MKRIGGDGRRFLLAMTGEETRPIDLVEFIANNEDGLSEEQVAALVSMGPGEVYRGGGGAEPAWSVSCEVLEITERMYEDVELLARRASSHSVDIGPGNIYDVVLIEAEWYLMVVGFRHRALAAAAGSIADRVVTMLATPV